MRSPRASTPAHEITVHYPVAWTSKPSVLRLRVGLRRTFRRLGYRLRPLARLLSVAAENPAFFTTITVAVSLLVTATITWVLGLQLGRYYKATLIALVVSLPSAGCIAFYLFNITHNHRAELAIRARRYADDAVILYLLKVLRRVLEAIFDVGPVRQPPLRAPRLMEVERDYARSRAHYLHVLLDHAAQYFRAPPSILEDCLCLSTTVLQTNAPQRVWLRYQVDLETEYSASYEPAVAALDAYAKRAWDRISSLKPIAKDFGLILRHVIQEPSTGRALAAAAPILARHLATPAVFQLVADLVDTRRGVPVTLLVGVSPQRDIDVPQGNVEHYLKSFAKLAHSRTIVAIQNAANRLNHLLNDDGLILTVGFSHLVASTIRRLSQQKRNLTVGIISPDTSLQRERVAFAEEGRLMESALLIEGRLASRVFLTSIGGMEELGLNLGDSIVLMGAEAITHDGMVVHPRGWRRTHDDLRGHLKRSGGEKRFVVCESFKVVDVPRDLQLRRLVTVFTHDEYEYVISDGGEYSKNSGTDARYLRRVWEESVNERRAEDGFVPDEGSLEREIIRQPPSH